MYIIYRQQNNDPRKNGIQRYHLEHAIIFRQCRQENLETKTSVLTYTGFFECEIAFAQGILIKCLGKSRKKNMQQQAATGHKKNKEQQNHHFDWSVVKTTWDLIQGELFTVNYK